MFYQIYDNVSIMYGKHFKFLANIAFGDVAE